MKNGDTGTIIKNDYEFKRAYKRGKSFVSPVLVAYCLRRRQSVVRIGITTGKKVGNAVCRSRARRVIRESYRHIMPEMSVGWDIIFVARTKTAQVKQQQVEESMLYLLKKAGVIEEKKTEAEKTCNSQNRDKNGGGTVPCLAAKDGE